MTDSQGNPSTERASRVRAMFARIASRYDRMNRLMTAGQDVTMRRRAIRIAALPPGGALLDIGAGTGDLSLEAARRAPDARLVAGDFTPEMMRVGRARDRSCRIRWTAADALRLPFAEHTFDAVVSGYLLRNVTDVDRALAEQWRVLKPGGRVVCLDTTPPSPGPLRPLVDFHLRVVIPALGRLIARDAEAYDYLPSSIAAFLTAEALAERLHAAGFRDVGFRRAMFGVMAIHWGSKPADLTGLQVL